MPHKHFKPKLACAMCHANVSSFLSVLHPLHESTMRKMS